MARRNRSWRRTYDYVWCCKSFKKLELMNLYCHSRAQRTRRILMVATRRNLLELFNHSVNGPKWSWVFLPGWSWRERIWFRWKGLFNWLHDLFNNFWDLGWETYTSPKRKKCCQNVRRRAMNLKATCQLIRRLSYDMFIMESNDQDINEKHCVHVAKSLVHKNVWYWCDPLFEMLDIL